MGMFDNYSDGNTQEPINQCACLPEAEKPFIVIGTKCSNVFRMFFGYDRENISSITVTYWQAERLERTYEITSVVEEEHSFIVEHVFEAEDTFQFAGTNLDTYAQVKVSYLDRDVFGNPIRIMVFNTMAEVPPSLLSSVRPPVPGNPSGAWNFTTAGCAPKCPLRYNEKFLVLESKVDRLQHEIEEGFGKWLDITQSEDGTVTVTLENYVHEPMSSQSFNLSGAVKSCSFDLEGESISITMADGSVIPCDLSSLFSDIDLRFGEVDEAIGNLGDRIDANDRDISSLQGSLSSAWRTIESHGGSIGALQQDLAPIYDSTRTYSIGDLCINNGLLYRCTTTISEPEDFDGSHWSFADVRYLLSLKQDGLTFDQTPTDGSDNPVTSNGVFDAMQEVIEVAEGKTKTYVVDADTQGNAPFKASTDTIAVSSFVAIDGTQVSVTDLKVGDVILVTQTDYPDRWVGGFGEESGLGRFAVLYKMETTKVDLSDYYTKSESDSKFYPVITWNSDTINSDIKTVLDTTGAQFKGTILGMRNPLLLRNSYGTYKVGWYIGVQQYVTGTDSYKIGLYQINQRNGNTVVENSSTFVTYSSGGQKFNLSNVGNVSLQSINGKTIPAYPSNDGWFTFKSVNGTLGWVSDSYDYVAPQYDDESTYDVGDLVMVNNALYRCTTAITVAEPFDSTHWTQTDVAGELASIDMSLCTSITYSDLVTLRNNLELKPGMLYRIVDYVTTTAQANTSSAGRQFDIVVMAVSDRQLGEEATALKHRRSGHIDPLSFCDMGAWQIRYCLDNDTDRFAWADTTNGKGVIYYMKDEFGNEAYYDFKNIRFTKSGQYTDAYTFSYTYTDPETDVETLEEATTTDPETSTNSVRFNRILPSVTYGTLSLPSNVFLSEMDYARYYGNVLMDGCRENRFDNDCNMNVLGAHCDGNRFYQTCEQNSLDANCSSNVLGMECCFNRLDCGCQNNVIDAYGYRNHIGNGAGYCFIGEESYNNDIGAGCDNVRIGAYAESVRIGNGCDHVKFDDGTGDDMYYCENNVVDPGCKYLTITCLDDDESGNNPMRNVHIHSGVSGTYGNNKTIVVPDRNLAYSVDYYASGSIEILV